MSISTLKKNLIDSDMIKLKIEGDLGFNPVTGEEGRYIDLEEFLNGMVTKPLSYYGSVSNAVNKLIEQGYGKIEIPAKGQTPLCYISIKVTSEDEIRLNLVTFGYRAPMRNARYYSILGETNWQIGDIIYNTDYIKTRCLGWICTKEGQWDSTWERFGDLDISKDKTLFEIIEFPNELPSASLENLGKFVLYSSGEYNQYHMWYCTRYFKKNDSGDYQLFYKWVNTSENESLIKEAEIIYQYDGWQVTKIEELEIVDENESYIREYPSIFAVYGKVPVLSEDDRYGLDVSDIQTIKIGVHRYRLKYYNNEYVHNGDIPEGIPILIYLNTELKLGYLPYIKPPEVNLPLVSILPQADYSMLGKRVLYQNQGVDNYPSLYYCTQVENEFGGIEFRWVKPREPNLASQVMEIELEEENKWNITKIGEIPVDENNDYLMKVSNTLILTGTVPTNSVDNQKIRINDKEMTIRYLDGTSIKANEIIINSVISIQVNLRLGLATISSTPQPIEFVDKTVVKVATAVVGLNGRWRIRRIGDVEIADSTDISWKTNLPEKIVMIVQIPSNSSNNQIIEIGGLDYSLNYISGVPVVENDFQKDIILTIYGNLSSNKLYIPAFPSTQAQQQADYTEVNNRIDLEIQDRESLNNELNTFKGETSTNFINTNNNIVNLRNNIETIVSTNFAKKESPVFSGIPRTPTPTEGDTSNQIATTEYVMRAISNLIDSSPETLNTLAELSQALGNDPNFVTTITNKLAEKLNITGGYITGTLILVNDSTVLSNQYNSPALVIGGTRTDPHLEIGRNQIQSKQSDKESAQFYINEGGGLVIIGEGGLRIIGDLEVEGNVRVSGMIESESKMKAPEFDGVATSAVVAYNLPTKDVGGNIWIFSNEGEG